MKWWVQTWRRRIFLYLLSISHRFPFPHSLLLLYLFSISWHSYTLGMYLFICSSVIFYSNSVLLSWKVARVYTESLPGNSMHRILRSFQLKHLNFSSFHSYWIIAGMIPVLLLIAFLESKNEQISSLSLPFIDVLHYLWQSSIINLADLQLYLHTSVSSP